MKRIFGFPIVLAGLISISGIIKDDVSFEKHFLLANEPQFNCVGSIKISGELSGSCVLISPKHILTAASVLSSNKISGASKDTIRTSDGKVIYVSYNTRDKNLSELSTLTIHFGDIVAKAKKVIVNPNYVSGESNYDLAVVELQEAITQIKPAIINDQLDEVGSKIVCVGFGSIGKADTPNDTKSEGKKIAGQNMVDSLGGYRAFSKPALLLSDFDHPTNNLCCNKMGDAKPLPLEYISTIEDAGGGFFRKSDDGWELLGITTRGGVDIEQLAGNGFYGQTMSSTRTSVFYYWITSNANLLD